MRSVAQRPTTRFEDYFEEFTRRDWQHRGAGGPARVAVVGTGWFAREWALLGLEGGRFTEPAVAVDRDPDRAERAARTHDIPALSPRGVPRRRRYRRVRRRLRLYPNATHLPYVRTAAEFGKDVLCEKVSLATGTRVMVNEILAGTANGVITGALVASVLAPEYGVLLGLIVGVSMVFNLVVAGVFSALIPLVLDRLGFDPATSATIFITTITDVLGFFLFLGLAGLVLL